MIEVLLSNGDRAEVADPAAAPAVALTLMDEASDGRGTVLLSASFYSGDRLVRAGVSRAALADALPKEER